MFTFETIRPKLREPKMRSLGLIAAAILVAIGIFLVVIYRSELENPVGLLDIGRDIVALIVLAGVGAFGGYLSVIQPLKPTHPDANSYAVRRAVLQGAAGAIIIVTLAPIDPNIVNGLFVTSKDHLHPHVVLKLIALAVIGGYAGGALLESSAQQFAKKIDDIEEKQKQDAKAINLVEEKQRTLEDEQKKDAKAINLVEEALHGLEIDFQALKEGLKQTTSATRSEIFFRADDNRRENWRTNKEAMERSVPIFKALTATDEAKTSHWWSGALAYCLKDKRDPDYEEALHLLDKAIAARGENARSGAYEFNRAVCKIHLSAKHPPKTWDAQILSDLDAAKRFAKFAEIIKTNSTVQNWLRQTKLDQAGLSDPSKTT
jgi:hypothetical protein